MTSQPTTQKRWRPRFSVRTLVVLVTLVCCYAACWGPTKTRGVADVKERLEGFAFENPAAKVPLIVGIDEWIGFRWPGPTLTRCYYFWFFGYVAKLPFEREL